MAEYQLESVFRKSVFHLLTEIIPHSNIIFCCLLKIAIDISVYFLYTDDLADICKKKMKDDPFTFGEALCLFFAEKYPRRLKYASKIRL